MKVFNFSIPVTGTEYYSVKAESLEEAIELLQLHFKYSYDKAKDACLLLTNEDLQELKQLTGGQT